MINRRTAIVSHPPCIATGPVKLDEKGLLTMGNPDESYFLVTPRMPETLVYSDGDYLVISQIAHDEDGNDVAVTIPFFLAERLQEAISQVLEERHGAAPL